MGMTRGRRRGCCILFVPHPNTLKDRRTENGEPGFLHSFPKPWDSIRLSPRLNHTGTESSRRELASDPIFPQPSGLESRL